jgi:urease accessory protein
MMNKPKQTLALLALISLSGFAAAHTGSDGSAAHAHGFSSGLMHPFTGLDHLLAMLMVGVWSSSSARRLWIAPALFALMLLAGALFSASGLALPGVEPMIAGSLIVVGALLLSPRQLPLAAGALAMGGFALFHGAAHGQELSGSAALAGMLLGTVILHAMGIALGLALRRGAHWLPRLAGAGVALTGLGLLLS